MFTTLLGGCAKSEEKAILGTWTTESEWGTFQYSFYSDKSCRGEYFGDTGGVYPSLHIDSYYEGCGDGVWSFEDGLLKVEYRGDDVGEPEGVGTMYYEYSFSNNYSTLHIVGNETYGERGRTTTTWTKVEKNEDWQHLESSE